MSYSKIYIVIMIVIVIILSSVLGLGYYIDKSQEERFAKFEMKAYDTNEYDNLALIARLKNKIAKLNEMAIKDPSKIAIIEKQKQEIALHIKAAENSHR